MDSFPNLARGFDVKDEAIIADVTGICERELWAAGINVSRFGFLEKGEVPSKSRGYLPFWSFKRRWYYWVAEGNGIPVELAERLHERFGREVRVAGHCGCPSPREWFKGFPVNSYHIDTPEGLRALADAIRSIYDPDADPDGSPYAGKSPDAWKEVPAEFAHVRKEPLPEWTKG